MKIESFFLAYYSYVNQGICAAAVLFSLTCIGLITVNRKMDTKGTMYLLPMAILNLIFSSAYVVELIYTGNTREHVREVLRRAIALEYLIPLLLMMLFSMYLFYRIDETNQHHRWRVVCGILYLIVSVVFVWQMVQGYYYYLDAANVYRRADRFIWSQVIGVGIMFMNVLLLLFLKGKLNLKDRIAMLIYLLAPNVALILQLLGLGSYVLVLATTLSLLCVVIYIQLKQASRLHVQEKELAEIRVKYLLSQFRPHFLYNALSSISQLCMEDPQQASVMTDRFAEFLRKNMKDMKTNDMIPFEEELEHIRNYIAIEKMRFGELIQVAYDIRETDFQVPSLVMQPIVENSIRYGIRSREEGGMLLISTRRVGKYILLTISDNGPGFRMADLKNDGKTHLGIEIVKKRMEAVPRASYSMTSRPGKGTTAIFILPVNSGEDT